MDSTAENKNKYTALALTVGVHIVLFLIFWLVVFVTPIPPFEIKPVPEIEIGLGMEGFGNTDSGGSGKNDTDIATTPPDASSSSEVTVESDAPNIVIDETATEVSVETNPNNVDNVTKETPEIKKPQPSSELSNALAILKNSKRHTGAGEGGGNTGGSGTGTRQGVGAGS